MVARGKSATVLAIAKQRLDHERHVRGPVIEVNGMRAFVAPSAFVAITLATALARTPARPGKPVMPDQVEQLLSILARGEKLEAGYYLNDVFAAASKVRTPRVTDLLKKIVDKSPGDRPSLSQLAFHVLWMQGEPDDYFRRFLADVERRPFVAAYAVHILGRNPDPAKLAELVEWNRSIRDGTVNGSINSVVYAHHGSFRSFREAKTDRERAKMLVSGAGGSNIWNAPSISPFKAYAQRELPAFSKEHPRETAEAVDAFDFTKNPKFSDDPERAAMLDADFRASLDEYLCDAARATLKKLVAARRPRPEPK